MFGEEQGRKRRGITTTCEWREDFVEEGKKSVAAATYLVLLLFSLVGE